MPLIKAIASALFGWIGTLITGWLQRREDRAQGAKDQAAKETASTVTVEAEIAKTEANTDRSQKGIEDAANHGDF